MAAQRREKQKEGTLKQGGEEGVQAAGACVCVGARAPIYATAH